MDVDSGTIFLKQKGEDWQQMLAQGQSSSPNKQTNHPKQEQELPLLVTWHTFSKCV